MFIDIHNVFWSCSHIHTLSYTHLYTLPLSSLPAPHTPLTISCPPLTHANPLLPSWPFIALFYWCLTEYLYSCLQHHGTGSFKGAWVSYQGLHHWRKSLLSTMMLRNPQGEVGPSLPPCQYTAGPESQTEKSGVVNRDRCCTEHLHDTGKLVMRLFAF